MQIDLTDQTNTLTIEQRDLIQELVIFAGKREQINPNAELSITIVHNKDIQVLNAQYRNKDEATDVLSFQLDNPYRRTEEVMEMPIMIGDIIISIDKAIEQAKRYNHSFDREIAFLTVHGFLHLLGYTHDNKEEEQVMFQKQESILEEFSLGR